MIVLDTTVLVYAVGGDHELKEPARRIIDGIGNGALSATTTAQVIQELVHVRARRRGRKDAAALGRAYADLLSPLLTTSDDTLREGLELYERHEELGSFDAVLAAGVLAGNHEAFVSADRTFEGVRRLPFVNLADPERISALLD